jgi:hypothetical protein
VFKPLVIHLLDPLLEPVPEVELRRAVESVESWLVRRTLVRAGSGANARLAADLVRELLDNDARQEAGLVVQQFLAEQDLGSTYWPSDDEVRAFLPTFPIYRRFRRGVVRMVLEAIEDHRRGWVGDNVGWGGQRVVRGSLAIEHVMPQHWGRHWPLAAGSTDDDRNAVVHTIGNLTLLTSVLNSSVSNGPWPQKRAALHEHDVLKLNSDLVSEAGESWDEEAILERGQRLTDDIVAIWPGHGRGRPDASRSKDRGPWTRTISLSDLIAAGLLPAGAELTSKSATFRERRAIVRSDGRIEVNGKPHDTPSGARKALTGKGGNGWRFFLVLPEGRQTLSDIWREYAEKVEADLPDVDELE